MITPTNNTPNFKGLYKTPNFNRLGAQGEKSLEIVKPFLQDISQDCDIYVGSAKNEKGIPTLIVFCTELLKPATEKIQKSITIITQAPRSARILDAYGKQSCSKYVNPESLASNAKVAKLDYLLDRNDREQAEILENKFISFITSDDYYEASDNFKVSFPKIPTDHEILMDTVHQAKIIPAKESLFKDRGDA